MFLSPLFIADKCLFNSILALLTKILLLLSVLVQGSDLFYLLKKRLKSTIVFSDWCTWSQTRRRVTSFRYKVCEQWWDVTKAGRPLPTVCDDICDLLDRNSWEIAIYEKLETSLSQRESSQATTSVFGQDKIYCEIHELPLSCDFPKNGFVCQFDCDCTWKSAWRCPSERCENDLCKKHFNSISEKRWVVPHEGKNIHPSL